MRILAMKPGHDGHIACLENGKLLFSFEAEKDNWPRYAECGPVHFLEALSTVDQVPDVIAISGWAKVVYSERPITGKAAFTTVRDVRPLEGGYFGELDSAVIDRTLKVFGHDVQYFSSSHERAHVFCALGLSPLKEGTPCYVLVWEGSIGSFYHVDASNRITKLGTPLASPGLRYQFLYGLADPSYSPGRGDSRFEDAGKLMALAAYGEPGAATSEESQIIEYLLSTEDVFGSAAKAKLRDSRYYNIGVQHAEFCRLARRYSDAIFACFRNFAAEQLEPGLPLLIVGGCGLNCDWNRAWEDAGLFCEVFIPPCTNDTGAAIGTAIEAQHHYTNCVKVEWDVYAGQPFLEDSADLSGFERFVLDYDQVSAALARGHILAWVQGRCEIGPRALGNRSIVAAPFEAASRDRLNEIKGREGFRPIAPVCMEEDMALHFDRAAPSPYMLFFQKVLSTELGAVTHVDGSARCQSVNMSQNPALWKLLSTFKSLTGLGVLCNTSLNFKGAGFINRLSDLVRYANSVGLDGFVVENAYYARTPSR